MNFSILRNIQGTVSGLLKKVLEPKSITNYKGIHQLCSPNSLKLTTHNPNLSLTSFLMPTLLQFTQVCGMKQRGTLQLRCKGCYKVQREGRMYVMCKLKPRHKQQQMRKRFKNRSILTFAHQKPVRDWR